MEDGLTVRIQSTKLVVNVPVNLATRHLVSASGGWLKLNVPAPANAGFCVATQDSHCNPAFNFLSHHFCRNTVAVVQRRQRTGVEKSVWQADLTKCGGNA